MCATRVLLHAPAVRRSCAIIFFLAAAAFLLAPRRALADANPFYGAFEEDVPIVVPPFHGIEPQLSLHYSSTGGNGPVGVGWSLRGFSAIERAAPGGGAPRYNSTDIFLLDGQELVPCAAGSVSPSCTTGGTHSTKVENYMRIAFNGTNWTVTSKDGVRTTFTNIYSVWANGVLTPWKWGISSVVDPKGNTVSYAWGVNAFGGCCWEYPATVSYNGTSVTLYWEQRSDLETRANGIDFATYYGRVKSIDVVVSGLRARSYKLTYNASGSTARSLLAAVQQYGKDAVFDSTATIIGGTAMPAISFTPTTFPTTMVNDGVWTTGKYASWSTDDKFRRYSMDVDGDGKSDVVLGPDASGNWSVMRSTPASFTDLGVQLTGKYASFSSDTNGRRYPMDVNGDGKTDMVLGPDSSGAWYVIQATGGGALSDRGAFITGKYGSYSGDTTGRRYPMDVDGDGKMDIVLGPDASGNWNVLRSTGNSFVDAGTWATGAYGSFASDTSGRRYPMDVNGDGKMDMVIGPDPSGNWYVLRSTGTSFVNDGAWITGAYAAWNESNSRRYPMDVNGDGKMDMVIGPDANGSWYVLRSTGRSFVNDGAWITGAYGVWQNDVHRRRYPMDVNGDGKMDMVIGPDANGSWYMLRSTGTSFVDGGTWLTGAYAPFDDGYYRRYATDVNGDGKADLVLGPDSSGSWFVVHPSFGAADLLARVDNGLGAFTTISYIPSSLWSNTNNPPIFQSVLSTGTQDGRGNSSWTSYTHMGGLWDAPGRQFLGFRYSKRTLPCLSGETACPYEETWFKQDNGSVGKPETVRRSSGAGMLLLQKSYEYATNYWTAPYQSLETGVWAYVFDGSGNTCSWPATPGTDVTCAYGARTYATHSYDNFNASTQTWVSGYANVVSEASYGNYDISGDERTVNYWYYPNTTAFITGKQAIIGTFTGIPAGSLLSQGDFYYDNAAGPAAPPVAGKPTMSAKYLNTLDDDSFVYQHATYDAWGNVTSETNEVGATTSYTIDSTYHQYITQKTNALGQTSQSTWDPTCGVETTTTDPNGQTTTLTHDNLCRLTYTAYPLGAFEQRQYVNVGDPNNGYIQIDTPAADGSGNQWVQTYYDGLGRTYVTVKKGASGNTIARTAYNNRGQVAQSCPPYGAGETPQYEVETYDAMDRVTRSTHADGSFVAKTYGFCSGWGCVSTTDELGHLRRDSQNMAGQPVLRQEQIAGLSQTMTFTYSPAGTPSTVTDGAGNTWSFYYDSLARRVQATDPDLGTWTFSYDNAGHLVSQRDAKAQSTTFTYDALGRRTQKTTLSGTPQATTATWTYDQATSGYSNAGRLTSTSNPAATSSFYYDALGRMATSSRTLGGTTYATSVGYDAGGRILWTQYPDGDMVGTSSNPVRYDGAGQLYSIPGIVSSTTYDARGNVLTRANANGTTTTKTYSPTRYWNTGIATTKASTTIQNLVYTIDSEGKAGSVTSPFSYEGWTFTYDQHRLATATNTTSASYNQTIAYDRLGNITSNSTVGSYAYPAAGSAHPHAVTTAGPFSYTYDANGNMLTGANRTIVWDGDNRVVSVSGATMSYDADGQRVKQVVGGVTTAYVSDDYEVTSGVPTKYVSVGGVPVARKVGTTTYWLHTSANGSIQAETNSSGVEVQRMKYRPYGDRIQNTTSLAESRSYTAQRQDSSGLFYLHERFYDPTLGRFVSPDPTVPSTAFVGFNRYAYASNDPVGRTDTSGLMSLPWWVDVAAIIINPSAGLTLIGLAGSESALRYSAGRVGAGVEYAAQEVAHVPFIGDIVVGILATNGMTGAFWAFHDFKGWVKPAARGAIMDAAAVLSVMAGGLPAPYFIAASAGIGFGQGFGIAKINGASYSAAFQAGVNGAILSAATATISVGVSAGAQAGIKSDADGGDPYAQQMVNYGKPGEAAGTDDVIPNHAVEGYSIGPNGLQNSQLQTGAYGNFSRTVSDNLPYANRGGYFQDSLDWEPHSLGGALAWGGIFVYAQTLNFIGPLSPYLVFTQSKGIK